MAQLLGQQVGVVRVAGEPEVEQHSRAILAQQHIGRFQIEVADVLLVQTVRGQRHCVADERDVIHLSARIVVQPVLQRLAFDVLHHDIGQPHQVTGRHKVRHMRAGECGVNLQLDLEAHDVFRAVAFRHAGNFHHQRKPRVTRRLCVVHAIDLRHASAVQAFIKDEAIDLGSRCQ